MVKSLDKKRMVLELVRNAELMIQAGMSHTVRTCGNRACGCHTDPNRRHGPHTYLSFKTAEGKSTGMYVAPEHVAEATGAKRAWDYFWETATKLAAVNREELRARWQAGRARGKR